MKTGTMASSDKTLLWLRQTVRPFELAMSVLPLRAEKARGHLAFAPELAEQSEGLDASSFGRLAELEPGSFWFRTRNRWPCWALEHYFPDATNFLEIGCGTGFVLAGICEHFPRMRLVGNEIVRLLLNSPWRNHLWSTNLILSNRRRSTTTYRRRNNTQTRN